MTRVSIMTHPDTRLEKSRLARARRVLQVEGDAILSLAERLDHTFSLMVSSILSCRGRLAVTGVGKSADVAQKLVGTFNSTGTRAYQLDATRAMHGDLGMVHGDDRVLVLSHSGESEEIIRLLPSLKGIADEVLALSGNANGTLAKNAHHALIYGSVPEACPLGLAPSTSTTMMQVLGEAMAFVALEERGFQAEDFAVFHPAGNLGRRLSKVGSWMRQGDDLRIASASMSIREILGHSSYKSRRTGAIMLTGADGELVGIFTDSDLARLFERHQDKQLDRPISEVMTPSPVVGTPSMKLLEAVEIFRLRKISELPILDENRHPVGLLDITDVIGLMPVETEKVVPTLLESISA
jgi:arabinose-5-phosphate isomerase